MPRKLVIADFGQAEPRVLAHYAKDQRLIDLFNAGQDFYSLLIKDLLDLPESLEEIKVGPQRAKGKLAGLSLFYGIGPDKLSRYLGTSYIDAANKHSAFQQKYLSINILRKQLSGEYSKKGFITSFVGRPIFLKATEFNHKCVNYLVQSTASDLCCEAQIHLKKDLIKHNIDAKLRLIVHDEVVYDVDEKDIDLFKKLLQYNMCDLLVEKYKLLVPLEIEVFVGDSWYAKYG